ncbi:MAG: tyrosine-type recombinase/integrase [Candidatus Thorarchaeota archaeon]
MKIITKEDLSYNYESSDYQIIQDYLNEVYKRSTASYKNQKSAILNMLNYVNKNLQRINMVDIKDYFNNVIDIKINKRNNKPIGANSKKAYRTYLSSFFDYLIGRFLENNIELRNPVPNKKIYKFTRLESDIKKQTDINEEIFTEQELLKVLNVSKKKSLRDFILFSLLIIDGARISEILTIKIENLHLEQRYYETGFEKNARKSTRFSSKSLIFFIPEKFKPYLEQYINYIGKNNTWLFPGRTEYYNGDSFRGYVKRNYDLKYRLFHKYRKTLISHRLIKMNAPLWISEGLTNHKISESTHIKHYAKFTIEQKRDLYDRYFPYCEFPYF